MEDSHKADPALPIYRYLDLSTAEVVEALPQFDHEWAPDPVAGVFTNSVKQSQQ